MFHRPLKLSLARLFFLMAPNTAVREHKLTRKMGLAAGSTTGGGAAGSLQETRLEDRKKSEVTQWQRERGGGVCV